MLLGKNVDLSANKFLSDYQAKWIQDTFNRRECIKFIQNEKNTALCMCGQPRIAHPQTTESILRTSYPVTEKWAFHTHTKLLPTNAFGTIEFQGGPHPTKAQYVRLSFDTKPEKILQLIQQAWGLELPKLLISVHGGIANFELQPKLRRVCKQGLFSAAKTTGAWVTTAGTNTGVMRHVGDALGDTLVQSRNHIITIGIAPWGVVHKRADLVGQNIVVPYHAITMPGSDSIVLNSGHSFFLLVDDGSVGRFGCEMVLRKNFEKYLAQLGSSNKAYKDHSTPVVCLLIEGGSNCIRTVLECVTDVPPTPVVVIDGSGRASDLLAFVHKYSQSDGMMPEMLKEQLLSTISKTFIYSRQACERVYTELMLCTKDKNLITVFRVGEESQDIDQSILTALLKSQDIGSLHQLKLTMAWDRVDMAANHIFSTGYAWQEGALDQAMMDALVNDQVDFVKLLIENGVNMGKWLTITKLEMLYNNVLNASKPMPYKNVQFVSSRAKVDSTSTLKFLLSEVRGGTDKQYFTLGDIGQVVNKLMGGGYQSLYCRRKFRNVFAYYRKGTTTVPLSSASFKNNQHGQGLTHFKYPYSELMIWAVLLRRQKMAMFMWERGEEALAKCLCASKLYKSMVKEAEDDEYEIDVASEIKRYQYEFMDKASELLDQCYKTDEDLTQLLLTYELNNWGNQTCLSLAIAGSNKNFIAHTCCQILLTEMWMGGLRTRKYPSIKVILGIFFFPSILFFDYRTKEELEMMPQPQDEHASDTDASSEASDEEEFKDPAGQTFDPPPVSPLILTSEETPAQNLPTNRNNVDDNNDSNNKNSNTIITTTTTTTIANDSTISSNNDNKNNKNKNKNNDTIQTFFQNSVISERRSNITYRNPRVMSRAIFKHPSIVKSSEKNFKKSNQLLWGKKISEFYTAPITKFWLHSIGYLAFLLIFIYIVLIATPVSWPSVLEWYIFAYKVGIAVEKMREMLTQEATKLRQKIKLYFFDLWNMVDLVSLGIFFIGFAIRFNSDLIGYTRALYALDASICIVRIVDFFSVSPRLGPFVHIIGKMLKEFLYLLVFILISMISFGTFRQSVWYPDNQWDWGLVREIFLKPYFMLYGEVYHEHVWPECTETVEDPLAQDQFKCVVGRWLVPVALSLFLVVGIIVLLSLVIAVFNSIFMKIYMQSNIVWKFQRYILVIEYEARPILPSPFILISHVLLLVKFIVQRSMSKHKRFDHGLKVFLHEDDLEKLHDFEEECVDMYYRDRKQQSSTTNDFAIKQTADKLEKAYNRLEDMQQRSNMMNHCMMLMEVYLNRIEEISQDNSTSLWWLYQQQQKIIDVLGVKSGGIERVDRQEKDEDGENKSNNNPRDGNDDDGGNVNNNMLALPKQYSGVLKPPSTPSIITTKGPPPFIQYPSLHHQPTSYARTPYSRQISHPLSSKPLNMSALPPIVTQVQVDYFSITDEIDTSCLLIEVQSPSDTAPLYNIPFVSEGGKKEKKKRKKKGEVKKGSRLQEVEEDMNEQLKPVVKHRLRQMSLSEGTEYANLAKHGLETIELPENDDAACLSDDGGSKNTKKSKFKKSQDKMIFSGGVRVKEDLNSDQNKKGKGLFCKTLKNYKDNLGSLKEGLNEEELSPVKVMASIAEVAAMLCGPHPLTSTSHPFAPHTTQSAITSTPITAAQKTTTKNSAFCISKSLFSHNKPQTSTTESKKPPFFSHKVPASTTKPSTETFSLTTCSTSVPPLNTNTAVTTAIKNTFNNTNVISSHNIATTTPTTTKQNPIKALFSLHSKSTNLSLPSSPSSSSSASSYSSFSSKPLTTAIVTTTSSSAGRAAITTSAPCTNTTTTTAATATTIAFTAATTAVTTKQLQSTTPTALPSKSSVSSSHLHTSLTTTTNNNNNNSTNTTNITTTTTCTSIKM